MSETRDLRSTTSDGFVSVEVVSRDTALRLPDRINLDDWAEQARRLLEADRRIKWMIGRWLHEGCTRFHLTHDEAALVIGCSRSTVSHYVRVVRAFPNDIDQQRFDVDWSHYRTVCDLPPDEAEELLKQSEQRGLTVHELEREVRRRYPLPKPPNPGDTHPYRATLTVVGDNPDTITQGLHKAADALEQWFIDHNTDATTTIHTP